MAHQVKNHRAKFGRNESRASAFNAPTPSPIATGLPSLTAAYLALDFEIGKFFFRACHTILGIFRLLRVFNKPFINGFRESGTASQRRLHHIPRENPVQGKRRAILDAVYRF
jgi:hypothetical protein